MDGSLMAILAGDLLGGVDGVVVRQQLALDDVVLGLVAVGAQEIKLAHMHVEVI